MESTIITPTKVETHGVLLAVTVDPGTNLNAIVDAVCALLAKNPGVREFDAEHLGEIECYDEDPMAATTKES